MDLDIKLGQIREALRQGQFTSEAAVSQGIVLPLLQVLGWPVFEISIVIPQYSLDNRRVDYALCHPAHSPAVFVEVKKVGFLEGADLQLFQYAFHAGVPMAVLTDGQEWSFYLPGEQGRYDERRVYKIDLLEREIPEASERLRRYLSYEKMSSGEALQAARADYKNVARNREINVALPKAWKALLDEQDSLLIDLLAEKAEDICGYKPKPDMCGHFLESIQSSGLSEVAPALSPSLSSTPKREVHTRPTRNNQFSFSFRGRQHKTNSARKVMTQIFQLLHKEDIGFLERFAARKHGRKRRYLARDKTELYPGRSDLVEEFSVEIVPGWWMGTNYSRRCIQEIIELAKEVAGPELGGVIEANVEQRD